MACAPREDSDQPDQSLRCPHEESLGPELPIERTAKTLIRLITETSPYKRNPRFAPNI